MSKRGRSHPVTLQFAVQYALPRGKARRMTKKIIEQAVKWWIDEGEAPDGFEVKPISWIHGDRETEASDDDQFRVTMGRLLQGGATIHVKMGRNERV